MQFNDHMQTQKRREENFLAHLKNLGLGIGTSEENEYSLLTAKLADSSAATVCNGGRSFRYNYLSSACGFCHKGDRSHTFITSMECVRDCFYCANSNQQQRGKIPLKRQYDEHENRDRLLSIGITGGEPLLYREEVLSFIRLVKSDNPERYVRIYTCADLLDERLIKELRDAGLNEIRVSIKPESVHNPYYEIYLTLTKCVEHFDHTVVEMPVFPDKEEYMRNLLVHLDSIGVDGINLLEFLYPFSNAGEYIKRDYKLKSRPFRVLYNYDYPGGLPVAGSELLALKLISYAEESSLRLGVHYCSLENKFTSQIYAQNKGVALEKWEMIDPEDFFIKSLHVRCDTHSRYSELMGILNLNDGEYFSGEDFIIINPVLGSLLMDTDFDMLTTYCVAEKGAGGTIIREVHCEKI